MEHKEQITWLRKNQFSVWSSAVNRNINELMGSRTKCFCGKLLNGDHIRSCDEFAEKAFSRTLEDLKYLLPEDKNDKES